MNGPIYPSTQVLVGFPGSAQPPTLATLANLVAARRTGQLPATATVQLGPNEPWFPVDVVLARAGLIVGVPATPMRPLLVAFVVAPPIWALLHALVFQVAVPFLLLLWALSVAATIAATSVGSLKTKTSKELLALVRRRPMLWRGVLATVIVCEVLTLGAGGMRMWRRTRAEAILAEQKDCDFATKWAALSEAETEPLDDLQKSRAQARLSACEGRQQEQAAAAYAEQCKQVAVRLSSVRQLAADDRALIGKGIPGGDEAYFSGNDGAEFAARIAGRSLKSADLGGMKKLPCGPATRSAYLQATAQSAAAWAALDRSEQLGDDVLDALGAEPTEKGRPTPTSEVHLSEEVKEALHKVAAEAAATMKSPKTASEADAAVGLCVLERRLGGKPGPSCVALSSTVRRLQNTEALARKNADARCSAAISARQRCVRGCDARQPHDELGMPAGDFDQSLDCYERCENGHPTDGCE